MVSRRAKIALWWRQGGTRWRIALFVVLTIALLLQILPFDDGVNLDEDAWIGNSLLVFLLVNLNVSVLLVLAFLVGRNVVKLFFDRRRNILGSQLRARLVLAFVGLALVPTSILFLISNGLLTRTMQQWFSEQIDGAVSGSVSVARFYHRSLVDKERASLVALAKEIERRKFKSRALERAFFEQYRTRRKLFSIRVIENGEVRDIVENAAADIETFREPPLNSDALAKAQRGELIVLNERQGAGQFIRAYGTAQLAGVPVLLVTSRRVSPELTEAIDTINDAYKSYEQLKVFRSPLRSGYVLTLAMITGLIIFAAVWIGFYIARDISVPIQMIAEGTQQVAKGNYAFQIRVSGNDELSYLARSFNKMTNDLASSTAMAEDRRVFIETVLAHLVVGVIAIDRDRRVTAINEAACTLFSAQTSASVVGRHIELVIGDEVNERVVPLIADAEVRADDVLEGGEELIVIRSQGSERSVVCTAGRLLNRSGAWIGTILIFDDVTELSKAQQMSAWREVARRIAHEIKNPLTPIQLSAQRLERLSADFPTEHSGPVKESVESIVQNVDSIKRLANEFSHFARLPTADLAPSDLNALIGDVMASYAPLHETLVFQFHPDDKLPLVPIDKEQIRRVIMNLVDNAIAAIVEDPRTESGRIILRTDYDRRRRMVIIEVSDNGPGVPDHVKGRIFDPYFTTKKSGTGIGLSVVTTIVNDHQGSIRVYDNQPRGTKFIIELSMSPVTKSLRSRGERPLMSV